MDSQLGSLPIWKLLMKYSIPAIIGMLVNALYNVVDRMFIGHIPGIGDLAITGVGITMPIVTIILGFSMLVGIGSTALISIQLGRKNVEAAEHTLGNGVVLASIMGVILMTLGILLNGKLLSLFGGNEQTIPYGSAYINVLLLGTIFNVISFVLTSNMRADGSPAMSAICMITGCIVNIILDATLIFGFDMGIKGAAFATIISQTLTASIGLWYFTKGKSKLKIKAQYLKLQKQVIGPICAIGLAPCAMQMAISLVQVIMNNVLSQTGGQVAIGAFTTINSLMIIFLMPIFGINQGAQPIIGYNYGAKNYERAKQTSLMGMGIAVVILSIGFICFQTAPAHFISLFDGQGNLLEVAVIGMRLYTSTMPILAISIVGSNYFQAIGRAKVATVLSLLRQVIILIPVILMMAKFGGLKGVWLAQPISDVICSVIIGYVLFKEFKSYGKQVEEIAA